MHATNTRTDNPQLSAQLFRSILYRSVARTELFTLLHVQHSASWPIWVYCSILLDVLHRRWFLPFLPVLRHNYPVLLKLSHADFNRFFAIDLTCSSCIWLKIEYCFIRIIPDRAENPEGKFFLDTKRIQSNIFIDERYGTVTIQAAEIIIKSFLTFCLPIEFLSSPTCESLYLLMYAAVAVANVNLIARTHSNQSYAGIKNHRILSSRCHAGSLNFQSK